MLLLRLSRKTKQIVNGVQLTLGLALLLISSFCLISIDYSYTLGIPLGLLSTVHALRFLIDQTPPLIKRISNAKLNIYNWVIGVPTLATLAILYGTGAFDGQLVGREDEKTIRMATYFIFGGGVILILIGLILTYNDVKSSYLQVTKFTYKRQLYVHLFLSMLGAAISIGLVWFLRQFHGSTIISFRGQCPFSHDSYGNECYVGSVSTCLNNLQFTHSQGSHCLVGNATNEYNRTADILEAVE